MAETGHFFFLVVKARLREERPEESPDKPVLKVFECQRSIDRAANLAGVKRIAHHHLLRHLFTTATESR